MRTAITLFAAAAISTAAIAAHHEESEPQDPRAEWQEMIDYGNHAYSERPRAILKIDDTVYLDEGEQAWLVRHEEGRTHYLWTMEEPEEWVVTLAYTGDTAPMRVRGQSDVSGLIANAMASAGMDSSSLDLEYDMLTFHEENESYAVAEGVELTAYPTQMRPGVTGMRSSVFNQNHPDAEQFEGLRYYDYNPDMVIEASFEPMEEFTPITFQTSRGWYKQFYNVGTAVFQLNGEEVRMPLYGFTEEASEVNAMSSFFTDAQSGIETYGVGRYLDIEIEAGTYPPETVTVDFNYAYNPNCARSPYYNCPYAEFDIAHDIPAGEMVPVDADH